MNLRDSYNVPFINNTKYYILLTNQATLRTWYYIYVYKNNIFTHFKKWQLQVENESSYRVKIVRLNNNIEFIDDRFRKLFQGLGVMLESTVIYTSKQNKLSVTSKPCAVA